MRKLQEGRLRTFGLGLDAVFPTEKSFPDAGTEVFLGYTFLRAVFFLVFRRINTEERGRFKTVGPNGFGVDVRVFQVLDSLPVISSCRFLALGRSHLPMGHRQEEPVESVPAVTELHGSIQSLDRLLCV